MKNKLQVFKSSTKYLRRYQRLLENRNPGFLVNFGQFPSSWIRIRIPKTYPDPGDPQMNADPDPQHCHKSHEKEGSTLRIKAVILLTKVLVMSLHTVIRFVSIMPNLAFTLSLVLMGHFLKLNYAYSGVPSAY